MKKAMLLAACLFLAAELPGQIVTHPQIPMPEGIMSGSLQIINLKREQVSVELYGFQNFSEYAAGDILLANLLPGEYTLRITGQQNRHTSTEYFRGTITIRPSQRTMVSIGAYGPTQISSLMDRNSIMLLTVVSRGYSDHNHGGYNDNHGRNNPYGESGRGQSIRDTEFERLLSDLKHSTFESDKLKVVELAAQYNMFTSQQAASMLNSFDFDDGKLKCAALLRGRITDVRNIYTLAKCFNFAASKDKFYEIMK